MLNRNNQVKIEKTILNKEIKTLKSTKSLDPKQFKAISTSVIKKDLIINDSNQNLEIQNLKDKNNKNVAKEWENIINNLDND